MRALSDSDFQKCVRHLQKMGYAINVVQPVDTAPHTKEVLLMVWMSRGLRLAEGFRKKLGVEHRLTDGAGGLMKLLSQDSDTERLLLTGEIGGSGRNNHINQSSNLTKLVQRH